MPWCPKCRTEYRPGFTKCADCGSELVAEQPPEEEKIPAWLEGMPEEYTRAAMEQQKATGSREAAYAQMAAMAMAAKQMEEQEGAQRGEAPVRRQAAPRTVYQDNASKANDNRSSAWTLLLVGVLGLVFLGLCITGVLPVHFGNQYLFYGVMGAMFVVFIIGGLVSMKNAKIFGKAAESENSLRNTLKEWCQENLDAAKIDKLIEIDKEPEELWFFKRYAYLKYILNNQFVNLDQDFLDHFIDDYAYDAVFGDDNA